MNAEQEMAQLQQHEKLQRSAELANYAKALLYVSLAVAAIAISF